jgi:SAM-dependent methyltransferase
MLNKLVGFALNNIPRPLLIKMSYMLSGITALFLKGDKFEDPIDGKKYRKLLPYGYGKSRRLNVFAPGSLSLERHRLLWLYLKEESNFFNEKLKVLHIAPEQCFYGRFKGMENLDYTSADIESPIADLHFDIQNIPLDDQSYDIVICNHVLEHVEDDIKAMKELYRILKKGGMGIFQIPQDLDRETTYEDKSIVSPEDREKHFGQYDHVRLYGKDYFQRLRSVGFDVEEIDYTKKLSRELIERYCLASGEILPICRKL